MIFAHLCTGNRIACQIHVVVMNRITVKKVYIVKIIGNDLKYNGNAV